MFTAAAPPAGQYGVQHLHYRDRCLIFPAFILQKEEYGSGVIAPTVKGFMPPRHKVPYLLSRTHINELGVLAGVVKALRFLALAGQSTWPTQ